MFTKEVSLILYLSFKATSESTKKFDKKII